MAILFITIVAGVMIMSIYLDKRKVKEACWGNAKIKEIYKGGNLVFKNSSAGLGRIINYSSAGLGRISSDGLNWKEIVFPTTDTYVIKILNDRFLAIKNSGTEIYETKDFINWTFVGNLTKTFSARGSFYGNDDLFFLNGYYIHSISDNASWERSTDLINWEAYTGCKTLYSGISIASNGNDKAIYNDCGPLASGDKSSAYTVDGGVSWKVLRNAGATEPVLYLNGLFFFLQGAGYVNYSLDAINWVRKYVGTDKNGKYYPFGNFSFCNGKYFALSKNLGWVSSDLINWEQFSHPSAAMSSSVYYFDGKYMIIGLNSNTDIFTLVSDDGINWEKQTNNVSTYGEYFYVY